MPVTVIAGPDQTREPSPPVPMQRQPGQHLGELAELVVGCRTRPSTPRARRPGDRHVAVVVVQRGERAQHDEQRVRRGAAELAAVLGALRACVTSIVAIAIPRSATVSVGTPGRTLPMSAITIASQRERPRDARRG